MLSNTSVKEKIIAKIKNRENIVKILVLIIVVIIGLNMKTILGYITQTDTPIAVVNGHSMYPLLREGDIVFAYKAPPDKIGRGDIIIYDRGGVLVIHRVIDIYKCGEEYCYMTKGDNNRFPDPGLIPYSRVKGVVISINNITFKIPYLGYLSLWYHGKR